MFFGILSIVAVFGIIGCVLLAAGTTAIVVSVIIYLICGIINMLNLIDKENKSFFEYVIFIFCLPCYFPIEILRGEREVKYTGSVQQASKKSENVNVWKSKETKYSFFEQAENFFDRCEKYLDRVSASHSSSGSGTSDFSGVYEIFPLGERYSTGKRYKLKSDSGYIGVYEEFGNRKLYEFPTGYYDADHNVMDREGNVYKKV